MNKRYAVNLIIGYNYFYGEESVQYEAHFFNTLKEAESFYRKHFPNCTGIFDLENLPF